MKQQKKKILVTCGPTWVALDGVRIISNQSTGEMGHLIAKAFHNAGHHVTLIEGPVTHPLAIKGIKVFKYRFFDELAALLKKTVVQDYDVICHAAAVSDFKPKKTYRHKIDSSASLTVQFVKTPKLIDRIKRLNPNIFLVGFKLEPSLKSSTLVHHTAGLFNTSKCDMVVANTLTPRYQGYVVDSNGDILASVKNKHAIAKTLVKYII